MVHAEHRKVLRPHRAHVALVRDRERAPLQVAGARRVHRAARERAVRRRARVVARADVRAALGRRPVRREALVARELERRGRARAELEHVARVRRVVDVPVHPPLLEGHVLQRCDGPIVVGEGVHCDVKPIHARMPGRCMHDRGVSSRRISI